MAKQLPGKYKCLKCPSSDARKKYENNTSFCFSCRTWFKDEGDEMADLAVVPSFKFNKKISIEEIKQLKSIAFKDRSISKEVNEFFEVKVSFNEDGEVTSHYYPYGNSAYKIRKLPKEFIWEGKSTSLFGKEKFSNGGKRVIITEGEIDALTIAQAYLDKHGKIYPVVAMSSATMTKSLIEEREWLRSFGEVVLCLDNDEAGKKAENEAVKIIGVDKVKIAKLPEKDPNEVYIKHNGTRLLQCIYDSSRYIPSGIISRDTIWDLLEKRTQVPATPYPPCLDGLNTRLKGMRGGEISLFTSGTGSGKSTIFREIILHLVNVTKEKIGVISLEESPAETAEKLSGMVLNKNPTNEEIPIEELKDAFYNKVFKLNEENEERLILIDHQGSLDDGSIVDKLEYMCLIGVKFIFIDHITILVSEGADDLKGNEAIDKVMNDLLRIVKKYPETWIGLVSHLRKAPTGKRAFEEGIIPSLDDIKGSGSIKQISFDIIGFARNQVANKESIRNRISMRVLKARTTSLTGDVLGAKYIYETGRLQKLTEDDLREDDSIDFSRERTDKVDTKMVEKSQLTILDF